MPTTSNKDLTEYSEMITKVMIDKISIASIIVIKKRVN
jgi:hypothetical protein